MGREWDGSGREVGHEVGRKWEGSGMGMGREWDGSADGSGTRVAHGPTVARGGEVA